jgi:lipase chaperone LimK
VSSGVVVVNEPFHKNLSLWQKGDLARLRKERDFLLSCYFLAVVENTQLNQDNKVIF